MKARVIAVEALAQHLTQMDSVSFLKLVAEDDDRLSISYRKQSKWRFGLTFEKEIEIKNIVNNIRALARAVSLETLKMSRKSRLTKTQSKVLKCLHDFGPLSSAELSRILFVTPPNLTGVIDLLEKKGFIDRTREIGDRRICLISLTEEGENLSHRLYDPIENKLLSGLLDKEFEEVQQLYDSINLILKSIDVNGELKASSNSERIADDSRNMCFL
jgi:DNA-binding MarR family transcriptional regulator